jgi:hypothetical protein
VEDNLCYQENVKKACLRLMSFESVFVSAEGMPAVPFNHVIMKVEQTTICPDQKSLP